MIFLITGVCGFIGSAIAKNLSNAGHKVYGVDNLSTGSIANLPPNVDFLELDLTSPRIVDKLPKDVDCILHLAGQSSGEISFENPVRDLSLNTISTLTLIQYGINVNASKFIYASSMSVYGLHDDSPVCESFAPSPLSCYGVGKMSSENYLRIFSPRLPYISFRMFNVYGPGQNMLNLKQGMVSIFLSQALSGSDDIIVKGDLERYRDFIYIDDVVDIWCYAALNNVKMNTVYNLGSGVRTTVKQLLDEILCFYPHKKVILANPTPGDQFGIYASTDKLTANFPGVDSFKSLSDGLALFIQSL